MRQKKSAETFA